MALKTVLNKIIVEPVEADTELDYLRTVHLLNIL